MDIKSVHNVDDDTAWPPGENTSILVGNMECRLVGSVNSKNYN